MAQRDKQEERVREVLEEKKQEDQERSEQEKRSEQDERGDPEAPPDEPDPRRKSSGHGGKTADKWNQ